MTHRIATPLIMLSSLALLLTACPAEETPDGGVNPPMDAAPSNPDATESMDAIGGNPDARPDAGMRMDATPLDTGFVYGTRLGANSAQIVQMTEDESTLYVIDNMTIQSIPAAGGAATPRGESPDQWYPGSVGRYLWVVTDLPTRPTTPGTGNLRLLKHTDSATASMALPNILTGQTFISPDNNHVVALANQGRIGSGATSTLTADLVSAAGDTGPGMRQTLRAGVHVGRWVAATQTAAGGYAGPCRAAASWLTDTVMFMTACLSTGMDDENASLVRVDTVANTATPVTSGVIPFVLPGTDDSYVLYVDGDLKLHASDAAGVVTMPVAETEALQAVAVLDGKRFLYLTESGAVKVASWPALTPTLLAMSVIDTGAISPDGKYLVMSENAGAQQGLADLFLLGTTTAAAQTPLQISEAAQTYQGDDTFSDDSLYVYWYDDVDQNFVGTIKGRKTDGTGAAAELAPSSYFVLNYGDPQAVLLFVNARLVAQNVVVDVAVRKRDASGELTLLTGPIDVNDFLISPMTRSKLVYKVISGAGQGLYVRDLPNAP